MKKVLSYKSDHWNLQHLLLLLLLTLLCYWPFTFGIFSAKNDNITQFLPVRFHVSEALRNGHLPLWTPYMYLGYPIHGDMQGGAWNPVVWVLSIFGRYNVTSLHWEILISIVIGAAGMYRLLGIKNLSPNARLIGAGAYLMCGYITDVAGSNLPFLWAAAYIPFALAYYYHLLTAPSLQYALKTAIALSLLLVSAYPSFFIIALYILAAAFLLVIINHLIKKNFFFIKQVLIGNGIAVIAFSALSAVAVFSYLYILPFYSRGNGVSLEDAFINSFHPLCSASFIFPTVPIKDSSSFTTDLISRNSYFNSLVLIFWVSYVWMKKTRLLNFTLAGIIFFYLFSLGNHTPVREWCYDILPLMDTFRHPSNARLFVIIGSIVIGISLFDGFLKQTKFPGSLQLTTAVALSGILIYALMSIRNAEIGMKINQLLSAGGNRTALKDFFDELSVYDVAVLNGLFQAAFLFFLILFLRKKFSVRPFMILFLLNSFLFAQFTIPYTLVSKADPSAINSILNNYPKDYPAPDKNTSIAFNSIDALNNLELAGITGFYNKKITVTDLAFTPTFMTSIETTMSDTSLKKIVTSNPYAYLAPSISQQPTANTAYTIYTKDPELLQAKTSGTGDFELKELWNNGFEFQVTARDTAVFCLQQLYLPGWKCRIDGKLAKLHLVNGSFMAIKIPEGKHNINFLYRPNGIRTVFILSVLSWMLILFLLIKKILKKNA